MQRWFNVQKGPVMRDLTTEELGHVYGAGSKGYDKKPKNEHKNNKNSSGKKNNSDDKGDKSDDKYSS